MIKYRGSLREAGSCDAQTQTDTNNLFRTLSATIASTSQCEFSAKTVEITWHNRVGWMWLALINLQLVWLTLELQALPELD